ncbi:MULTISPECIES: carboxymuconolactone decarboxylase family protein [Arthrobacter]|uniref:Carboxymuconolactone decarboxylase family protein n=2 Tax=Arthrobacter TaxID=1663 RepID=A0ABU9KGT3_9MICC|nr:carboxymuconolactone decarboxylase family protein [Arthrobacter sp. YJM1]MDP5226086.1 carboxymuconolactone decarboxylase family protein [Arthrobacter sp. YJM1]
MSARVNISKAHTDTYKALGKMSEAATKAAEAADISPQLCELLKIRASQLNGCAYCIRVHTRAALKLGETTDRVSLLTNWRETEYFTAVERASLALTEAITMISDRQVPDDIYVPVSQVLSEEQISAVSWLTVAINSYNRVNITSGYPVKP